MLSARLLRLISELLLQMRDYTDDPLPDAPLHVRKAVDESLEGLEAQEEPMRGIVLHVVSDLSLLNTTLQHKHTLSNGTDRRIRN